MEQSSNKSRAFLSNLDDQQLRQILLAEVESDDTDVDLIRNITAVLESRDHAGTEIDAQKAYHFFVEEHAEDMPLYDELLKQDGSSTKRKPVRFSRLARVGIVAAIILSFVIVTTGIASAAGVDIIEVFTKWTSDIFGFTVGAERDDISKSGSDDPLYEVRAILADAGITTRVVPLYLPDGYVMRDTQCEVTYEGTVITSICEKGRNWIILSYVIGDKASSSLLPKDKDDPSEYMVEGITHYLYENEGEWSAIWQQGKVNCQISGVTSKEELLVILNSIYEGK